MADFRRQKRYTTREPLLKVDGGLPAGTYVFELQVEDESGNLSTGDRVKVTLRFRGREMAHQELGRNLLKRVESDLEGLGVVEQFPKMEGRQMIMIIVPKKK